MQLETVFLASQASIALLLRLQLPKETVTQAITVQLALQSSSQKSLPLILVLALPGTIALRGLLTLFLALRVLIQQL